MGGDGVGYEPASVKELLGEMKDIAELLVDLSYSAVLFDSPELARAVLELEGEMDVLQLRARMSLVMAGRSPDDAEALAPVFGVVGAAEKMSDAAGDVAKTVLDEVGLPAALVGALPDAVETLARVTVADDAADAGRTLGELSLATETGVRVLAARSGDDWVLEPDRDTELRAGDVLVCRGPADGVAEVHERFARVPYEPPAPPADPPADLDRAAETVVLMRELSGLAVDLAYGSVLFDDEALAEEVQSLEVEVDALKERLEAWALRAAAEMDEPVSVRGLLHIAAATEVISDAALEISEGVLRGLGSHPVVAAAVAESDEVLVRETVAAGSPLDGTTLGEAAVRSATGMHVVAVRREAGETPTETGWVLSPGPATGLAAGDRLVARGTRRGADRLAALARG